MTRVAAWRVLRSGSPTPMREVDRAARARRLDDRDRALLRRLVGTEVRRRGTLRALVLAFTRRRPKPELTAHLHLGMVQLLFLDRVPEHAALSETCGAVAETVGQAKVSFVHGVLRNVIRMRRKGSSGDPRRDLVGRDWHFSRDLFRDPAEHPLLWAEDALGIPAALMKRFSQRLGRERAEELARFFLSEPPLSVRPVGVSREALARELAGAGIEARAGMEGATLIVPAGATAGVTASEAFTRGRATIQGEVAAAAARIMEAQEGERLLDLCAAPGGKTALLAESGAQVVACDVDPARLERVRETCTRLGVAERVECVESDGTAAVGDARFDGVLVDAPCSNTGVLGARPGARWRFGPKSLSELGRLQERLLAEGADRVRPGGRLVWSTCSLEPEENGRRVRAFLTENPAWELELERDFVPDAERGPRDGGYAARLRRSS